MRRSHWKLWATVVLVVGTFVATIFSDNRPELGLDLQGGISVVLFPVDGSDLSTLDTAVEIISSRVNALGVNEPEVNRQGDTIVIDLPGAKDREEALALVGEDRRAEVQAGARLRRRRERHRGGIDHDGGGWIHDVRRAGRDDHDGGRCDHDGRAG
ncbi:MAG: hypothetical protein M5T61_11030 [Acidimicrobiia bacterium]|nr:hypothetical protein [Acidimicrobiia bacterium]